MCIENSQSAYVCRFSRCATQVLHNLVITVSATFALSTISIMYVANRHNHDMFNVPLVTDSVVTERCRDGPIL